MRLPLRKSDRNKLPSAEDADVFLSTEAITRLSNTLQDLEKRQRPEAAEDKFRAAELGDLRENAEYQDAKARLNRINHQILSIKERLARAVVIKPRTAGDERVGIGCSVTVLTNGKEHVYQIVGTFETDPTRGRISSISPVGKLLLGRTIGETVTLMTERGSIAYKILSVR